MLWEFLGPAALYFVAMNLFTFLLKQHAEHEKRFAIIEIISALGAVTLFLVGIYGLGVLIATLFRFSFGPDVPLTIETIIIVMTSWMFLLFVLVPSPYYMVVQPRRIKNLWLWLTNRHLAILV